MNGIVVGALLGALLGAGLAAVLAGALTRARLSDRVAPFLSSHSEDFADIPSTETMHSSWSFGSAGESWWVHVYQSGRTWAVGLLNATFGAASTQRRLVQLGRDPNIEDFRMKQLRWSVLAMTGMAALGCMRSLLGNPVSPVAWLTLTVGAAVMAACVCDYQLTRAAKARSRRIAEQLPTVAELLAFSVAAGLGPASALTRVANRTGGELAAELRRCTDEVASGRRFVDTLEEAADRMNVPAVTQFVHALVVAIERGTPLAEVLRAQAMDARALGHRELMEQAGKREVLAMVPVVFLILPLVVVIAIYPGIHGLLVVTP